MGLRKQQNTYAVQGMFNQVRTPLPAEKMKEGKSVRFPVSAGKVLKGFQVSIKGSVKPTFTGAPVLEPGGIAAALIESVKYQDDNAQVIKSITPDWARYQARYLLGQPAIELYKTNSLTLGNNPSKGTLATPFAIAATTQDVAISSSFNVYFENVLSQAETWQNTFYNVGKQVSNYIEITFKKFTDIQQYGETLITAATGDVDVEIILFEAPAFLDDENGELKVFDIFRQTYITPQFKASGETQIELPRNGKMQGIFLQLKDGANRTLISYDDAANVKLRLVRDGNIGIAQTTLLALIQENMGKRNIADVIPATAYMPLMNNSFYTSALPANSFAKLELFVTLPSTMTFSPALLTIGIDDITKPQFS